MTDKTEAPERIWARPADATSPTFDNNKSGPWTEAKPATARPAQEYIRADLAAPVTVEPLEWVRPSKHHFDNGICHGDCEQIAHIDRHLHWYRIYPSGRDEWRWVEQFRMTYVGGNEASDAPLRTAEEAKAAAQADYERRILSALTPAPQTTAKASRDDDVPTIAIHKAVTAMEFVALNPRTRQRVQDALRVLAEQEQE